MSRKISGFNRPTTGTSKVVMEATSSRTQIKQTNTVFTAGREYSASNFYKGSSRPPKMRVLGFFTPLVGGLPNTNNDTYIIFQIYDYTINAFRGPYCGGTGSVSTVKQVAPLDFYVSTIDKFGKNYGDLYSGNDSSISATFTPPTINLLSGYPMQLGNMGARTVTINAGHAKNVIKLQGQTNRTVDFHGFITVTGYNGTWGLYSLSDNGTLKSFETTANNLAYRSNTYPYLTPLTGKYTSEWRYMPMCARSVLAFHYFPMSNAGGNFGGGIRFAGAQLPARDIFNNAAPIELYTDSIITEITSDWVLFNTTNINIYLDEQATEAAQSGYYTTANYYAYYDSGTRSFSGVTSISNGGGNLTLTAIFGPHPDGNTACMIAGNTRKIDVYYDANSNSYYEDSFGMQPFNGTGMYFYDMNTNNSVLIDEMGSVIDMFRC